MTNLHERMKEYEGCYSAAKFTKKLPMCVRLDGRSFSKLTKNLEKPFSSNFATLMHETTKFLIEESSALIGYTQSDEITLIFFNARATSEIFFDGKIQKVTSVLAGLASGYFNSAIYSHVGMSCIDRISVFDCRAWLVPNKTEAANVLLWRERDAVKNSVTMAAQAYYSHKELMHKNTTDKLDMLIEKGTNWNEYPAYFKRGAYFARQNVERPFTTEELDKLPEQHAARKNSDLKITRSVIKQIDMPVFDKVVNKEHVIFNKAEPLVE